MNLVNLIRIDTQHGRTGNNQSSVRSPLLHKIETPRLICPRCISFLSHVFKNQLFLLKIIVGENLNNTLSYQSCVAVETS